jgi:hypothetical protein
VPLPELSTEHRRLHELRPRADDRKKSHSAIMGDAGRAGDSESPVAPSKGEATGAMYRRQRKRRS